nr:DNA polymerase zeta processivity subunit [Tanacetum cinerariifolium]
QCRSYSSDFQIYFVTNFPDNTTSKDLWEVCQGYGTVVDVYIPNRKSKARKRFAFVRFIKVENVDRLVGNLYTLWIGRIHLHANVVRFERSPIHFSRPTNPIRSDNTGAPSFASALKGNPNIPLPISSSPAMVLDDSCVVTRDLDNYVIREVKQFSSINNLRVLLSNEGFQNLKLAYLGGLWVMIELESSKTKTKFMQHVGVASWFSHLCNAQSDFVSMERIVWVDIEVFKDVVEVVYCSDDESVKGANENNVETSKQVNLDAESDVAGVSETYFGKHDDNLGNDQDPIQPLNEKETSNDPFNIYDLLKKHDKGKVNSGLDTSFPYPPGFTPEKDNLNIDVHEVKGTDQAKPQSRSEGLCSRIFEETQSLDEHLSSEIRVNGHEQKKAVLSWRSSRCFPMNCLSLNIQVLGFKAKKEWIRELNIKHKVNFLTLQETKMDSISAMDVKLLWGNYNFDHVFSEAVGNSGGILCTWDSNVFHKEQHIISDNFIALYGTWNPNKAKLLMISIYAPQSATGKRSLWSYITSLITHWNGDCMVMGDFNEVRCMEDRMGPVFNVQGANEFNNFISNSGLVKVQLEGYSFTWSHPSATKMSKLDHFLVTEDDMQFLKKEIRVWVMDQKQKQSGRIKEIKSKLSDIKKLLYQGGVNDEILLSRMDLLKQMQDIKSFDAHDCMQKAKIQWAIEGDENSKFFHGIMNRKRANLAIKGVMVDGEWMDDPSLVKEEFRSHFATRFQAPGVNRSRLNFRFPNRLNPDQVAALENPITRDEIRNAVWACGENKSPGPDGFTFEFFHKFWNIIGSDLCVAVEWFFDHTSFTKGCNSSFVALILKTHDPKFVSDYRPISLIGSLYKDYLDDVLRSFGFGSKWCSWISGSLISRMASILINGSPTSEFQFHCGLKQGDPLTPYLFILIMESLHLSFSRAVDAGIFTGIKIGSSLTISHRFYADDAVFIGAWSNANLTGTFSTEFKVTKGRLRGSNGLRCGDSSPKITHYGVDSSHLCMFWNDTWVGDTQLRYMFSCIYALEINKDRWVWDLNGEGVFRVKDLRNLLDESFFPKDSTATRWVKSIPIKISVFAWTVYLDRLPTRLNLIRRGVQKKLLSKSCFVMDRKKKLSPQNENVKFLVEFLQVAITEIIFLKGIYPSGAFERRRYMNLVVHTARHPQLHHYIQHSLNSLVPHIQQGLVERVAVIFFNRDKIPIEKFMFKINVNQSYESIIEDADVELSLRAFLAKLSQSEPLSKTISKDWKWEIMSYFRSIPSTNEDADMWVGTRTQQWQQPPLITPIKSMNIDPLFVQLYIEHPSLLEPKP